MTGFWSCGYLTDSCLSVTIPQNSGESGKLESKSHSPSEGHHRAAIVKGFTCQRLAAAISGG